DDVSWHKSRPFGAFTLRRNQKNASSNRRLAASRRCEPNSQFALRTIGSSYKVDGFKPSIFWDSAGAWATKPSGIWRLSRPQFRSGFVALAAGVASGSHPE